MVKNKDKREQDGLTDVESALTRTEQLIEENQRILTIIIGAAVLIVVAYLGYTKFYLQPHEKDAQEQMFGAEQYFAKDSFNLALNGDGNYLGFLDVIDDYGSTKAGNLAKYYTGISYLKLGQYQNALDYLNDFDTDDILLLPISDGAKGDAYRELGQNDEALSSYKKAYTASDNDFSTPIYMMKAADILESTGDLNGALDLYKSIKETYPKSNEARNIDKYIARIETKEKK